MTISNSRSFAGADARRLIRHARVASLGTIERNGGSPYVSLVSIGTDYAGQPLFLISGLARHTRNLQTDPRASMLIAEPARTGDPLTGPRVTVLGRAGRLDDGALVDRYIRLNPQAAGHAAFPDFSLWRLQAEAIHAVAGFGRIETMPAEEVFLKASALEDFAALERDALALGAGLGADDGTWRATAIDPDGVVRGCGNKAVRLDFEEPVLERAALTAALAQLAHHGGPARPLPD